MEDNDVAYDYLVKRGVTRLCHFTKVKSLVNILFKEDGILATDYISQDIRQQNDTNRFDNATNYVCCSLQYPNGWYWNKAKRRDTDTIFHDWCVLTIDLTILKNRKFRFCVCNSAIRSGQLIRDDVKNISALFDENSIRMKSRPVDMLNCCPTDDQAEILIYENIPLPFIKGIIIGDVETAKNIGAILKTIGRDLIVFISPDVCNTNWSSQVRRGQIPKEQEYAF